ncbi:hypothetical protein [Thermomonas sp.]|uniref:hypothetical protein n=1 Tax=Thermomonas sp. TaxID=1971895 RepID=UPI002D1FBAF5|nr:hypothetical protein [Thermomonas sp.]
MPMSLPMSLRRYLPLALLLLVACSKPAPEPAAAAPAQTPPATTTAADAPTAIAVTPPEETCTHEPRTDPDDKRPRCGGVGSPQANVSHAYRITLENGESFTACDITQPFSGKIGRGMITLKFTPNGDKGGAAAWHFSGEGGVVDTAYNYSLSGPEERMTGTFQANSAVCGKAAGLTACAAAKQQTFTSTWTRIEACSE